MEEYEAARVEELRSAKERLKVYAKVVKELQRWRRLCFKNTNVDDDSLELLLAHVCATKGNALRTSSKQAVVRLFFKFLHSLPRDNKVCRFGEDTWAADKGKRRHGTCILLANINILWRLQMHLSELVWRAGEALVYLSGAAGMPASVTDSFFNARNVRYEAAVELEMSGNLTLEQVGRQSETSKAVLKLQALIPDDYYSVVAFFVRQFKPSNIWVGIKLDFSHPSLTSKVVVGPSISDGSACEAFSKRFAGNKVVQVAISGADGSCMAVVDDRGTPAWDSCPLNDAGDDSRCLAFTRVLQRILKANEFEATVLPSLRLAPGADELNAVLLEETVHLMTSFVNTVSEFNNVEAMSMPRLDISTQRSLAPSNLAGREALSNGDENVVTAFFQGSAVVTSDAQWRDKPQQWIMHAKYAVMLALQRELDKFPSVQHVAIHSEDATAVVGDEEAELTDLQPYVDVTTYVKSVSSAGGFATEQQAREEDGVTRKVVLRLYLVVDGVDKPVLQNWVVNGRWIPPPDRNPESWRLDETWLAYLDRAVPDRRYLRHRHFLPGLIRDYEVWRSVSPCFETAMKLLQLWASSQYVVGYDPIDKSDDALEWLMYFAVCGMVYCDFRLVTTTPKTLEQLTQLFSDDKHRTHYQSMSAVEIFVRALKVLALHEAHRILLVPLASSLSAKKAPVGASPVPSTYEDFTMMASKCFGLKEEVVSSQPHFFITSAYDPRGILINQPNKHVMRMAVKAARQTVQLIESHYDLPKAVFRVRSFDSKEQAVAVICLKAPNALLTPPQSPAEVRFKNLAKRRKVLPATGARVDETHVLGELIYDRIAELQALVGQASRRGVQLVYEYKKPYPLVLLAVCTAAEDSEQLEQQTLNALEQQTALPPDLVDLFITKHDDQFIPILEEILL